MLEFWEKENIFEKSVENRRKQGARKYVFFDGPPFANGLPHYGHILANALKDAVTRYWTMKGYFVPRVNGWDCHGLPVEYEIEKELKLSGRKDIEKMGVAKFNTECRKSVFRYTEEWEKLLKRIARWVDFEHSYATLENEYMESIWWVFNEIWKKKMVYQGYKSMHVCPRCETPLSNFEVTLGYKDVADLSVTVKLELVDEPGTYFLAWTTTPWSLLSTMGLSIHPDLDYVKVKTEDGRYYYVAEKRLETVFQGIGEYTVVEKMKGKKLVGKSYHHLFNYYDQVPEIIDNGNVFHTFLGDYVSDEDGTGIVTINGSYGDIDFEAAKKNGLPVFVDVQMNGHFGEHAGEFKGMFIKESEPKIADYLKKKGLLFRKDPIRHSYPHCWRCDTPLMNYATKAWFVRVTEIKDQLLKNNQKIRWVPEHIKDGRFGKWLENVRDWNISRNRFWGCPIPVWECADCGSQKAVSSIKELRENSLGGNTYIFVRHGQAENNLLGILNSDPKKVLHLTQKGKDQIHATAKLLKKEKIDLVFASPFARTKETAEILTEQTGLEITFDQHLVEHQMGNFDGQPEKTFPQQFQSLEERYSKRLPDCESFKDVEERLFKFLDFLQRKYSDKTILIVTHGNVVRAALRLFGEKNIKETFESIPAQGSMTKIYSGKLPIRDGNLDLHKPYIDDIQLKCESCGKAMKRIPEVFDCWFESGAMPYAQLHYPFENKEEFEQNFPAHFIAEGLDQTRGWFYTLHVLATILFNTPAFKNVIVNGILLAANGEKLSKRKKNYPDPTKLFETHGADSTRLFLYASNAAVGEDVRFSERHVEEIVKKFTLTMWNTYSFFVTYAKIDNWTPEKKSSKSKNKLDLWILSELNNLVREITKHMDEYDLTKATRPLLSFADNLSNWYVRRSRRRFWKSESDVDKNDAYSTLYTVLLTVSKLIAPFMPATADSIYKNLTAHQSVHLEDWPKANPKLIDALLMKENSLVRKIVTLGHSIRSKKNVKVRQPLAKLQVVLDSKTQQKMLREYLSVIAEELNVKKVEFLDDASAVAKPMFMPNAKIIGPKYGNKVQEIFKAAREGNFELLKNGKVKIGDVTLGTDEGTLGYQGKEGFDVASEGGLTVSLDTTISQELLEEGYVREIIRNIQEMRKDAGYHVADRIYVYISAPKPLEGVVTRYTDLIKRETLALEIQEGGDFEWDRETEMELDGTKVKLGLRK